MLYNRMRPRFFKEVVGQENSISVLKDGIEKKNIPGAMLFVGTRGTGKTTVARILARRINCENPQGVEPCGECEACKSILQNESVDVMELDAASHNGVDDVRELLKTISYQPLLARKVVILDEVHMLSTAAFNALLKVLEEPPAHVHFILCTTELHKIPATILSRCRKVTFSTIAEDVIVEKLREVNASLGLTAEEEALSLVAQAGNGSMRDALSIYEAFINGEGTITQSLVRSVLGLTQEELLFSIMHHLKDGNPSGLMMDIETIVEQGSTLQAFGEEFLRFVLKIISLQAGGCLDHIPADKIGIYHEFAEGFTSTRLFEIVDTIRTAIERKGNVYSFQSAFMSLLCKESTVSLLEKRVQVLEETIHAMGSGINYTAVSSDVPVVSCEEPTMEEENLPEEDELSRYLDYASCEEEPFYPEEVEEIRESAEEPDLLPSDEKPTEAVITPTTPTADLTTPLSVVDIVDAPTVSGGLTDDELAALGFSVAPSSVPFPEVDIDGEEISEAPVSKPTPVATDTEDTKDATSSGASEQTNKKEGSSTSDSSASDFARQFESFLFF